MPLYELTIHEAKELLDNKIVSSEDLTRAVLDRIKEVEPSVKSFVKEECEFRADIRCL